MLRSTLRRYKRILQRAESGSALPASERSAKQWYALVVDAKYALDSIIAYARLNAMPESQRHHLTTVWQRYRYLAEIPTKERTR